MGGLEPAAERRLTIGTLSARSACHIETIRYYERIGLMPAPARSEGGHRLYGEDHVKRLGFIRRSRDLGFTLAEIRTLLRLVDGRRYTCAQVKRITLAHLEEVRRKVADLRRLGRVLTDMVAACEDGTVPACPVIDALLGHASSRNGQAAGRRRGPRAQWQPGDRRRR
jgi:MerR family mercuric resistance operon transcriptional regulator